MVHCSVNFYHPHYRAARCGCCNALVARTIFYGQRGELRQRYKEGQEDQLGALGLVVNATILWNTMYLNRILDHIRETGQNLNPEDVMRLSPLQHEHLNVLGRYHFNLPEPLKQGQYRPLRNTADVNISIIPEFLSIAITSLTLLFVPLFPRTPITCCTD